mmetsp:Transcript_121630/g.389175  ORF Transcript_121630/g.389175 Transcript_121630/m.389175 type:complete len:107 (-) Transcript_121630:300-620(-)
MGFVVELPDVIFWCFSVCFLALALLWRISPVDLGSTCDSSSEDSQPSSGEPRIASNSFGRRLWRFARVMDASLVELLFVVYCMGIASACMNTFVFLLIDDLGGSTA